MTQELFNRELQYQTMMVICRRMQKQGILSDQDVAKVENLLYDKYKPVFRAQ